MGQSSSQFIGAEAAEDESLRTSESSLESDSQSSNETEAQPSTKPPNSPPTEPTMRPAHMSPVKKRARDPSSARDEEPPQKSKKVKAEEQQPATKKQKPKVARAVPQHRRGTAIMPRQDTVVQPPCGEARPAEQPPAAVPLLAGSSTGEDTKDAEKDVVHAKTQTHTRERERDRAKPATAANEMGDEVIVNPVGRPGPRRKKLARVEIPKPTQVVEQAIDREQSERKEDRVKVYATVAHPTQVAKTIAATSAGGAPERPAARVLGSPFSAKAPAQADRIPTPPRSLEQSGAELNHKAVGQTKRITPRRRVNNWLSDPHSPMAPDATSPHVVVSTENATETRSPQKQKMSISKVKSREKIEESGDEYEPDSDTPIETFDRGSKKGAWSAEEKALADSIYYEMKKQHGFDEHAMIDWLGAIPEEFKQAIWAAFPSRAKKSIKKFCQRRYHGYKVGEWTEEDDEQLKAVMLKLKPDVEAFGDGRTGHWVVVSSFIDRHPDACRDRWKIIGGPEIEKAKAKKKPSRKGALQVLPRGVMAKRMGPWTWDEEEELRTLVDFIAKEAFEDLSDEERVAWVQRGENKEEFEECIDWKEIEKQIEYSRTAKQARDKWRSMKRRAAAESDPNGNVQKKRAPIAEGTEGELTRKQQATEAQYNKLSWKDVYDALVETGAAFKSDIPGDQEFEHESTFWSIVASRTNKSGVESKFRKHGKLRRRCFYGALERFAFDRVDPAHGMSKKARILVQNMAEVWQEGWDRKPGDVGVRDAKSEKLAKRTAQTAAGRTKTQSGPTSKTVLKPKQHSQHLSKEIVDESDDEDASTAAPANPFDDGNDAMLEILETQERMATADAEVEVESDADGNESDNDSEGMEVIDEYPISSMNSRYDERSLTFSPKSKMNSRDFLARCRTATMRTMPIR